MPISRLSAKICFFAALFFLTPSKSFSQICLDCVGECVTCHDFNSGCDGYTASQTDCGAKDCSCGITQPLAFADALQPGLVTRQEDNALVVTAVLPGSPASAAHILPGDRIVLLNGKIPTLQSCTQNQWSSASDPNSAVLRIVRGSARRQVTLNLIPVGQILAKGWLSRNGQIRMTALSLEGEKEYGGFDYSYLLGFKWQRNGNQIAVSDILVGSPAQQRGMAIGDRIEAINGIPVDEHPHLLSSLLPSDRKATVKLTILKSDGSRKSIELTSIGISAVFHSMATASRSVVSAEPVSETF